MRDYDKDPLILENKFGKHMFFIAKLQIFFTILVICFILYNTSMQDSNLKHIYFALFLNISCALKDYKQAHPIKQSKIVFYNFKIECIDKEKRILDYLRLDNITNIEVKNGITFYYKNMPNMSEKERVLTNLFIFSIFIYLPTFMLIYKYPIVGIPVLLFFTSYLLIKTFGINLNKTNTLVMHSDEMLEPIQLAFLDKNEQNLLKEYFMKRCKRLIKFY